VSTPDDRVAIHAGQDAWAAAAAYRPEPAEDTRDHAAEIRASHKGRPTTGEHDRQNGAGIPAVDKGAC
jgi:hypothetical protein